MTHTTSEKLLWNIRMYKSFEGTDFYDALEWYIRRITCYIAVLEEEQGYFLYICDAL